MSARSLVPNFATEVRQAEMPIKDHSIKDGRRKARVDNGGLERDYWMRWLLKQGDAAYMRRAACQRSGRRYFKVSEVRQAEMALLRTEINHVGNICRRGKRILGVANNRPRGTPQPCV